LSPFLFLHRKSALPLRESSTIGGCKKDSAPAGFAFFPNGTPFFSSPSSFFAFERTVACMSFRPPFLSLFLVGLWNQLVLFSEGLLSLFPSFPFRQARGGSYDSLLLPYFIIDSVAGFFFLFGTPFFSRLRFLSATHFSFRSAHYLALGRHVGPLFSRA